MTATVMPNGVNQYFDSNGNPLSSGTVETYAAGTSTPKTTWADAAQSTPNANPIVLNAGGFATIFWSGAYKIIVKDSIGNVVTTVDNVQDSSGLLQTNLAASSGSSLVGFLQSGTGAVARTVQDKARDVVNIRDFGAVLDGVTNDTSAIQAALTAATGGVCVIPSGTTLITSITIPAGTKVICNGTTFKPHSSLVGTSFIVLGGNDIEFSGAVIDVSTTTYSTVLCISASSVARLNVRDVKILNGGSRGVWTANCTDSVFQRLQVLAAASYGIQHTGASSNGIKTLDCTITGLPAGGIHGIQNDSGYAHIIHGCKVSVLLSSLGFGINFNLVTDGIIDGNTVYDTIYEGINITDSSSCSIKNNRIYWTGASSADFGISLNASTVACNFNVIEGNTINRSYKAGIALAGTVSLGSGYNVVANNTLFSTGLGGVAADSGNSAAGVLLYGTGTIGNQVLNNTIYGDGTNTKYGVIETTALGGTPNTNVIGDNYIQNVTTTAVSKSGSGTREYLNGFSAKTWTPTVTSGTGSITTLGTVSASYIEIGGIVHFYVNIPITTNGTGASDIRFTLPFNTAVAGIGAGRESGVSGSDLTCTWASGGNTAVARTYNNTYPGANGAIIEVSGSFMRA